MTTIATDGLIMAADGLTTTNGVIISDASIKIVRLNDGRIAGFAGNAGRKRALIKWLNEGGDYPSVDDADRCCQIMILSADGVETVDGYGDAAKISVPAAIGSGNEFALGAMLAGLSPADAVAVACQRDIYSGGAITSLTLEPKYLHGKD